MDKNNLYLKEVKLSGYKSIVDVDICFEDGLNLIIGKNAAGKTNFLKFLSEVLDFSFDNLINFSSELSFDGNSKLIIKSKREIIEDNSENTKRVSQSEVDTEVVLDGNIIEIEDLHKRGLDALFRKNNISITTNFVKHGIPKEYYLINSSFSFKIDKTGFPSDLISKVLDSNTPYFIKNLLATFIFSGLDDKSENLTVSKIKKKIINDFKEVDKIKDLLIRFSPIEDVRFNKNINIFLDEDAEGYTVNNLFIEFKIQGSWHPFENLSDGTKRLFYIISEIGFPGKLHFSGGGFGFSDNESKRIILIEEPELGIHPHQLMQLMEFLKIESHNKQIIVTSHSPIILDILNENELNRIVIAFTRNKKEGTILRHLNKPEINKAKLYLEEDYLSDYWKYSDLEKE
ncbi:MAG: AAA family ATPase [Flavobacteriaceae bacterium]|nr:AAA family ATPase [Flavobacteriaceae bacterium]